MPLLIPRRRPTDTDELTPAPSLPIAQARPARPLRIALVTEYYYPHLGGICEHVHFFAREVRRHGHQVDIVTSRISGARRGAAATTSCTCTPRRPRCCRFWRSTRPTVRSSAPFTRTSSARSATPS